MRTITITGKRYITDTAKYANGRYICTLRDNFGMSVIDGHGKTEEDAIEDAKISLIRSELRK